MKHNGILVILCLYALLMAVGYSTPLWKSIRTSAWTKPLIQRFQEPLFSAESMYPSTLSYSKGSPIRPESCHG